MHTLYAQGFTMKSIAESAVLSRAGASFYHAPNRRPREPLGRPWAAFCGGRTGNIVIEGNQKLGRVQDLRYGVAITDACMEWDSTTDSLREAAALMRWTQR